MNKDFEIEECIAMQEFENGLNKMYEWLGVALFEAELPGNLREKITKRIAALRAEK